VQWVLCEALTVLHFAGKGGVVNSNETTAPNRRIGADRQPPAARTWTAPASHARPGVLFTPRWSVAGQMTTLPMSDRLPTESAGSSGLGPVFVDATPPHHPHPKDGQTASRRCQET
jgi:hypothetical protein